jgi:hypothetical protein
VRKYLAGGAAAALLIGIMGAPAGAQEKKTPALPPAKKAIRVEAADPTQPGPLIQERLGPNLTGTPGAVAAAALPSVILRGRVMTAEQLPAVLLELDPKVPPILVASGGYFGWGGMKLQVVSVTAGEVRIEIGSGNQLILR